MAAGQFDGSVDTSTPSRLTVSMGGLIPAET